MTTHANSSLRRHLRTIFNEGTCAGLSDGQLLEQFATKTGPDAEPAFTLLIERHGPMVFRVCRSILRDLHEADDAFQATFLIMLSEAGKIRKRESIGPWLHGVARRVATCARSTAARRRVHERRWFERRRHEAPTALAVDQNGFDLSATIHAELDRLPERYRTLIVLCDLEACSLEEAARQLGWPIGTVKSRLNRGRQRLRDRLIRRGLAPGLAIGLLSESGRAGLADAAISPKLVEATTHALTKAGTDANLVSTSVTLLTQTVLRTMFLGKLKVAVASLFIVGLAALSIGAFASSGPRVTMTEGQTKADVTKAVQRTEKAAGVVKDKAAAIAKPSSSRDDGSHIETITISGRAHDSAGQPVASATIYIINANRRGYVSDDRALSTVITGPDGHFVVHGVKLPIWKPDPGPVLAAEEGRFQVAGTASGFGFTWHEVSSYRPVPRPPAAEIKPGANTAEVFYQDEPIQADLVFGPAVSLHGKVDDDLGHPLAGVKVQVGLCDDPRRPGGSKIWTCDRVDLTDTVPRERRAFDGILALPEVILYTHTGPDGTYRIDNLPRDVQFLTLIDPGPEFKPMQEMIATSQADIKGIRSLGFDAVLDHTFASSREAGFSIKSINTKEPIKNATVRAKTNREMLRSGSVGKTDDNGLATLQLRPGDYEFVIEPPRGALYRPAQGTFKIGKEEVAEIHAITLEHAALVILEAVDAKNGAGIEGVRFQYETDTTRERRPLHSQLVFVDHPSTDERGQLRAIVEPGHRRFFADTPPRGWKLERSSSELLELAAGRELTIRFAFTKVEDPTAKVPAKPAFAPFPDDLIEKWRRQQRLAKSGKLHVRRDSYFLGRDPISADAIERFLDETELSKISDPAAVLEIRFPTLPKRGRTFYEIIDDGVRRRNTYQFESSTNGTYVGVDNGLEVASYMNPGQLDVFDGRKGGSIAVYGITEFCTWPFLPGRGNISGPDRGDTKRTEIGDRLTVERKLEDAVARWVVDRKTGFVHLDSFRWNGGRGGQIVRQYGPTVFHDGGVLPRVHIKLYLLNDQVNQIFVDRIEHADLAYRPDLLDFVIAPPAGTVIVDYREDREHPKQGFAHYPPGDVIVYADGISSRNRRIEPVLKPGQPAPALRPASWLNRNGPIDPPDLAGKVVLIDFWGISCGPCVAELPEVQAAADHFASKEDQLVLIGLHESGTTVDQVATFAAKRTLTYRLAIDRPADEDGWFGAAFKAYGVRAIPSAAVIDRQGRIVFVGRFTEALQQAASLLEK